MPAGSKNTAVPPELALLTAGRIHAESISPEQYALKNAGSKLYFLKSREDMSSAA
jgi:hypothetical protein